MYRDVHAYVHCLIEGINSEGSVGNLYFTSTISLCSSRLTNSQSDALCYSTPSQICFLLSDNLKFQTGYFSLEVLRTEQSVQY
jgi:hypothetical protein